MLVRAGGTDLRFARRTPGVVGVYFAGKLPRSIDPPQASWEAFVELAGREPGLLRIRHIEDPDALRVAFLHALARKRAFVPKLTAMALVRGPIGGGKARFAVAPSGVGVFCIARSGARPAQRWHC